MQVNTFEDLLTVTNDPELTKPILGLEHYGKSLNPRKTFGWKQIYIEHIGNVPVHSVTSFKEEYGIDLSNMKAVDAKEELTKTFKIEGIGNTPQLTYQNAVRQANDIFNKLAFGQYENSTAYLWDRINPNYVTTVAIKLDLPAANPKTIYMIYS